MFLTWNKRIRWSSLYYSDDSNLDFGTIICALGVRYKSYCANIVRTLMVDPSEKQQKDYDFLLKVEEEILNKLQDGKTSNNWLVLN